MSKSSAVWHDGNLALYASLITATREFWTSAVDIPCLLLRPVDTVPPFGQRGPEVDGEP